MARVYLAAATAGVIALVLESLAGLDGPSRFSQVHAGSLAAYSLGAGLYGLAVAAVASIVGSVRWRRAVVVGSLSLLIAPGLLYRLHTVMLPGDPWHSQRSLTATAWVAALVVATGALLGLAARLPGENRHVNRWATLVGAVLLPSTVVWTFAQVPREPPLPARDGNGPDLALIVLDATRRDHLSLYGYDRRTSPELERWAAGARLYGNALSPSSWTVGSMERLLWPASGSGSLPRRLQQRGYRTAAYTDNPHLRPTAPMMAGFDRVSSSARPWRALIRDTAVGAALARVRPVSDVLLTHDVLDVLATEPGPLFLYVHLMDAHAPYRFGPFDGVRRSRRRIEFPDDRIKITAEEREDVIARYDAGVRSADQKLGLILAALEARQRPYLAIVTADHGESLGEHGRWTHGRSLAPELLRVPLLVRGVGVQPGRVDALSATEDAASTLLAAAGAEPLPGSADLRTSSGVASVTGALPPRLAFRVDASGRKVETDAAGKTVRVFDWTVDPDEQHDLGPAAASPALVAGLREALEPRMTDAKEEPLSAEARERLRSLGYVAQ